MIRILRAVFVENLGLKLISLVASIVLFFVVHGAEDAQKSIYVDVISTLPDSSSGRMLVSDIPVRVRVTLNGSPGQLQGLRPGDVPPIELDLRDPSLASYEISPVDFDLPSGVNVQAIEPSSIALAWAERRERRVRVRPTLVGEARRGRMLRAPVRVEPDAVLVVGPKEEVLGLTELETAEIDVSTLGDGRTERRVRFASLPAHVLLEGDGTVNVTLEVVPEQSERTFLRVAVSAVGLTPRGLRPTTVNVVVSGPPEVVRALDAEQILPVVDAAPLRGEHAPRLMPVTVNGLPDGVEVVRVSPAEILVTPG